MRTLKTVLNRSSALAYLVIPPMLACTLWYRNRDVPFVGLPTIPVYVWLFVCGGAATWLLLFRLLWLKLPEKYHGWLIGSTVLFSPAFLVIGAVLWLPAECLNTATLLRGEYEPRRKHSVFLIIMTVLTAFALLASGLSAVREHKEKQAVYSTPKDYYGTDVVTDGKEVLSFNGDTGVYVLQIDKRGYADCVFMIQDDAGWRIARHLRPQLFRNSDEKVTPGTIQYYAVSGEQNEVILITVLAGKDSQGQPDIPHPFDTCGTEYELIYADANQIAGTMKYIGLADVDQDGFRITIPQD